MASRPATAPADRRQLERQNGRPSGRPFFAPRAWLPCAWARTRSPHPACVPRSTVCPCGPPAISPRPLGGGADRPALRADRLEFLPGRLQRRFLAGEVLPPLDHHVAIGRADLHPEAGAPMLLGSD